MGGIREIEFFAQIHQLIWGGREPTLRTRPTCETLAKLAEFGIVEEDKEKLLHESYQYLRKLEHRLQMIADEQTHSLPYTSSGIAHIACFMGYDNQETFEKELYDCLSNVHGIYASSFKSDEKLGDQGNLVFTGTRHDPETLKTLRAMGYANPERVSEIVMGWHHGSRRATRTKRARELLTELMPLLLKSLGKTAHPDEAFLKFNDFLRNLPAVVQLFSLFQANPHLLELISEIMGSAPTLAQTLSRNPELLDAVLYADFYGTLPSLKYLAEQLDEMLEPLHDFEARMDSLRLFRSEKQFQAGVQLLKNMITAEQASSFLSNLAEVLVQKVLDIVSSEFVKTYGRIKDSQFAIIALGKLGSCEMTFSSDIDLVFVYSGKDYEAISDGEKGFTASVYYSRMVQRLLGALTAMGRAGRLYEVDTRLRPSGAKGMMAVSIETLAQYFDESAWTFEFMAFSKARAVCGDHELGKELDTFIHAQLTRPRDAEKLRVDVADMRERIAKEHGSANLWELKYVDGGLMDIDFMAQYLVLLHAPNTPGAKPGSAIKIFDWLRHSGRMPPDVAMELIQCERFLGQVFNMLRLCSDRTFDEKTAQEGLKKLLVESVREASFDALRARLIQVEQSVHGHYTTLLHPKPEDDA
jgi:glutamate-ammonia-ligase adenylyltransferase